MALPHMLPCARELDAEAFPWLETRFDSALLEFAFVAAIAFEALEPAADEAPVAVCPIPAKDASRFNRSFRR